MENVYKHALDSPAVKTMNFFLHLLTVRIDVLHHLFCFFSSFDLFVDILRSIYLKSTIY